jgi:hypothetical protein
MVQNIQIEQNNQSVQTSRQIQLKTGRGFNSLTRNESIYLSHP